MSEVGIELVRERIQDLWDNTDFTSTLFGSLTGYAVIAADFDGNVIAYNEGARQIYGYAPDEVSGRRNIESFFPPDFVEAGHFQQAVDVLLATGRFAYEGEKVRKDGTSFPAQVLFTLTKDHSGNVVGFVEIVEDLTERMRAEEELRNHRDRLAKANEVLHAEIAERKRAEEGLRQTAVELGRSNMDLEQFAYVASHDLQEPLRMVSLHIQLLQRRYQGKLDEQADKYILRAVEGSRQMQTLIKDLLAYARVGTRGKELESVDCEVIFNQAMSHLAAAVREGGAEVTHDTLPLVRGDTTQLVQLFLNLIGNGLKFKAERIPLVHVKAQSDGAFWRFAVRDNGIGIDPRYYERLFVIFQRLHSKAEYPGTGIGLAICKKIVERHGGRIWVESEPGKGTIFFFTLLAAGEKTR
jgi:PAS domain S-box-containing protein